MLSPLGDSSALPRQRLHSVRWRPRILVAKPARGSFRHHLQSSDDALPCCLSSSRIGRWPPHAHQGRDHLPLPLCWIVFGSPILCRELYLPSPFMVLILNVQVIRGNHYARGCRVPFPRERPHCAISRAAGVPHSAAKGPVLLGSYAGQCRRPHHSATVLGRPRPSIGDTARICRGTWDHAAGGDGGSRPTCSPVRLGLTRFDTSPTACPPAG